MADILIPRDEPISPPRVVLCLSGHDPTGGAGVQADIEAVAAMGCLSVSVITALTCQDTFDVYEISPQQPAEFLRQARRLVADVPIDAIKIGLLGSVGIAEAVVTLLDELSGPVPLIIDPILAAGGGRGLATALLESLIREALLPKATVATPNGVEARRLSLVDDLDRAAEALLAGGCRHVLITGGHETGERIINRLYRQNDEVIAWDWPKLTGQFHGSGCTLASALAARLALGETVEQAAEVAQAFTFQALSRAYRLGRGQAHPGRSVVA